MWVWHGCSCEVKYKECAHGCSCDVGYKECAWIFMDVLVRLNIKSVGMDVLVRKYKECGHGCSCEG